MVKSSSEDSKMSKIPRWMSFLSKRSTKKNKADKNEANSQTKALIDEAKNNIEADEGNKTWNVRHETEPEIALDSNKLSEVKNDHRDHRSYDERKFNVPSDESNQSFATTTATKSPATTPFSTHQPPKTQEFYTKTSVSSKISRKEINFGIVRNRAQIFEEKIAQNAEIRDRMTFNVKKNHHKGDEKQDTNVSSSCLITSSTSNTSSIPSSMLSSKLEHPDTLELKEVSKCPPNVVDQDVDELGNKKKARRRRKSDRIRTHHLSQIADEHNFLDDEYLDQPDLTLQESPMVEDKDDDWLRDHEVLFRHDHHHQQDCWRHPRPLSDEFKIKRDLFFKDLWTDDWRTESPEYTRSEIPTRIRHKPRSTSNHRPLSGHANPPHASTTPSWTSTRSANLMNRRLKDKSGSFSYDSTYVNQDVMAIKTLLLKLKRVLQEDDEKSLNSVGDSESLGSDIENQILQEQKQVEEIHDLRRQIVLLQEQNEEKDRAIRVLQRQLRRQNSNSTLSQSPSPTGSGKSNVATQTERSSRAISCGHALSSTNLSDTSSVHSGSSATGIRSSCKPPIPKEDSGDFRSKLRRSRTPLSLARHKVITSSNDGTLRIPIQQSHV